jgi:hypothetical protein
MGPHHRNSGFPVYNWSHRGGKLVWGLGACLDLHALIKDFVQLRSRTLDYLNERLNATHAIIAQVLIWLKTSLCKQCKSTKLYAKHAGLLGESGQMSEMWISCGGIVDGTNFPSNESYRVISPVYQAGLPRGRVLPLGAMRDTASRALVVVVRSYSDGPLI